MGDVIYIGLVVVQCVEVLVHGDGLPCGQLVLDVTLMLRQQLLPLSRGLALQRLVRFLEPLYTHAGT